MKKFFALAVLALSLVACNESSDAAADAKDSLDSIANAQINNIDSAADARIDNIDSVNEAKKDLLDSTMNNTDTTNRQ